MWPPLRAFLIADQDALQIVKDGQVSKDKRVLFLDGSDAVTSAFCFNNQVLVSHV